MVKEGGYCDDFYTFIYSWLTTTRFSESFSLVATNLMADIIPSGWIWQNDVLTICMLTKL